MLSLSSWTLHSLCLPGGSLVKDPSANAGDMGSILGLGRSPGGGHANLLQYSCLENPMDRGEWWATVHSVAKSQAQWKQLSTHPRTLIGIHPQIGTCHDCLPSASTGIKSCAAAASDFQYSLKEFGVENRNEVLCVQGKTGRADFQIVRYYQELNL